MSLTVDQFVVAAASSSSAAAPSSPLSNPSLMNLPPTVTFAFVAISHFSSVLVS